MNSQMFIPEKIKVGYQNRSDTYTKKLAYVIYYDKKGVLRKENSWESWRDKSLSPDDFENKPMEGFVINRNGGGARASYGWNVRHEFVRVFDPRGFEFEISIANLLYILQESNSMKGKGLEGEFIYAWAGTSLCLLPVGSSEHKACTGFTELQGMKVSSKSLVPGCVYETKREEKLIYMGKLPHYYQKDKNKNVSFYDSDNTYESVNYHTFVEESDDYNYENLRVRNLTGLTSLAKQLTTEPIENFAEIMNNLLKLATKSPATELIIEKTSPKVILIPEGHRWRGEFEVKGSYFEKVSDDTYVEIGFSPQTKYVNGENGEQGKYVFKGFTISKSYIVKIDKNFNTVRRYHHEPHHLFSRAKEPTIYTKEEVEKMELLLVNLKTKAGQKVSLRAFASNKDY